MGPRPACGKALFRHHEAERCVEALAERVAVLLPDDPMQPLEVSVTGYSFAVRDHLRASIARRTGGSIGIKNQFATDALEERLVRLCGRQGGVWTKPRIAMALLKALPELWELPDFAPARASLSARRGGSDPAAGERDRAAWALGVASVIDGIMRFRPDVLTSSEEKDAVFGSDPWLRVCFDAVASRLDVHNSLAGLITAAGEVPVAPEPIAPLLIYGVVALSPLLLRAIDVLARHTRIEIFVNAPFTNFAGDYARTGELVEVQHPLVTFAGSLSRDFQVSLEAFADWEELEGSESTTERDASAPTSLLAALQQDLLLLTPAGEIQADREPDDSVQIHTASGPLRQVEVLREVLLRALQDDPSLSVRDIMVLTPDLDTFAPLVDSVFSEGRERALQDPAAPWGPVGSPSLPTSIESLGLRKTRVMADAMLRMLRFAAGRQSVIDAFDWLSHRSVKRAAGLDQVPLSKLRDLWLEAGLRWGLDAEARTAEDQPAHERFTWKEAISRLALGVVDEDSEVVYAGLAPVAATGRSDVDVSTALVAWMIRAEQVARSLSAPRPLSQWVVDVEAALSETILTSGFAAAQFQRIHTQLHNITAASEATGWLEPVTLQSFLLWIQDAFDYLGHAKPPSSGAIEVGSLALGVGRQARIVVLLGFDDGRYPAKDTRQGYDPVRRRRLGDADRRDEDLALLLTAVHAAKHKLLVFYSDREPVHLSKVPPSPAVSALVELARAYLLPGTELLTTHHPLQPFEPDATGRIFDRWAVDFASHLPSAPRVPGVFCDRDLEPDRFITLTLQDLSRLKMPATILLRRLKVSTFEDARQLTELDPVDELEGPDVYTKPFNILVDKLWEFRSFDDAFQAFEAAMLARSVVPLGALGGIALGRLRDQLHDTFREDTVDAPDLSRLRGPESLSLELEVDGRTITLTGTLRGLSCDGVLYHYLSGSKSDIRKILPLWITLAFATALGLATQSKMYRSPERPIRVAFVSADEARDWLCDLVRLYQQVAEGAVWFEPSMAKNYLSAKANEPRAEDFSEYEDFDLAWSGWRAQMAQRLEAAWFANDQGSPGLKEDHRILWRGLARPWFDPARPTEVIVAEFDQLMRRVCCPPLKELRG